MAFLPAPAHPHPHPHPHRPSTHRRPRCQLPSEISAPVPTPVPPRLHRTTIYHLCPTALPHLPRAAHPADDDALLLAVSLNRPAWLRARYPRTSAFLREAAAAARVYPCLHGTPGPRGLDAPPRPKNAPRRLCHHRGSVLAAGAGLPWRLAPRDLVTRGRTALRDVLTDGPLVAERGTELVRALRHAGGEYFLTLARNSSGAVLRAFVVRAGDVARRLHRFDGLRAREFAVCGDRVVVTAWRAGVDAGVLGLVKGLFDARARVAVDARTEVLLAGNDARVRGVVDGVLTNLSVSESATGVSVIAKRVLCEKPSLTVLQDIRSAADGVVDDGDIKSSIISFDITDSINDIREITPKDILVMDVAKVYDTLHKPDIYIGYDRTNRNVGLWNFRNQDSWIVDQGFLSGALYNPQHTHLSVIHHTAEPSMLFFEADSIAAGPIASLPLPQFLQQPSIDGTWTDLNFEYDENATIQKSAYELFAEKEWNDIDSGFSSLGLR